MLVNKEQRSDLLGTRGHRAAPRERAAQPHAGAASALTPCGRRAADPRCAAAFTSPSTAPSAVAACCTAAAGAAGRRAATAPAAAAQPAASGVGAVAAVDEPIKSRDHQEEEVVGPRRPYENAFPRCASPYREKHSELAETPGLCAPMSPIGGRVEAKLKPCRTACSRR